MEDKKNYYAIIPANVRYDKEISANAKLLYGEITALCNEKGYCWASNDYFANLYGVNKRSVSRLINSLIEKKYIYSEIIYKENTKIISKRILRLNKPIDKIVNTYRQNCPDPIDKIVHTPIDKNVLDNNTYINNTINNKNNKEIYKEKFEKFYNAYPKKQTKAKTEEWFIKNKPKDELFKKIMDKLELFKQTKQWKTIQYIPMPITWLNQKRWEDDVGEIPKSIETSTDTIDYSQYEWNEDHPLYDFAKPNRRLRRFAKRIWRKGVL